MGRTSSTQRRIRLGTSPDEADRSDPLKNWEAAFVSCQCAELLVAEAVTAGASRTVLRRGIARLARAAAAHLRIPASDRYKADKSRDEFLAMHSYEHYCRAVRSGVLLPDVVLRAPAKPVESSGPYRAADGRRPTGATELWLLGRELARSGMGQERRLTWLAEVAGAIYPPLFDLYLSDPVRLAEQVRDAHYNSRSPRRAIAVDKSHRRR